MVDSILKLTRSHCREARERLIWFSNVVRALAAVLWTSWRLQKEAWLKILRVN